MNPLGSHSSRPPVARWLQQPTREQREPRCRSPIWPCSGWGLACRHCCQWRGGLLPAADPRPAATHLTVARTISPLPVPASGPSAVCFLFHFPSPRGARPLAGILLCGARTFLCTTISYSDCPASFTLLSYLS